TPSNSLSIMKKNTSAQAGFFHARMIIAAAFIGTAGWIGMLSFASTPPTGTLTDTSGPVSYTAGPFNLSNPTPVIELDSGPECGSAAQPCDDYALTVTLPSGYHAAHPNAAIKVSMSWTDSGAGQSDYDIYIYKNPRPDCS